MSTTIDRVKEMLIDLAVDQVEFGRLAGASKSVVNQWISGKIQKINPKYAYSLEQNCGYNAQWIITGEGDKKHLSPSPYTQAASKGAEFNANGSATSQSAQPNIDQTLNVLRDLLGELPEPLKKSALLLVSDYLASPDENTAEALQKAITGLLKGHDS